jgi:hypothetical protein
VLGVPAGDADKAGSSVELGLLADGDSARVPDASFVVEAGDDELGVPHAATARQSATAAPWKL